MRRLIPLLLLALAFVCVHPRNASATACGTSSTLGCVQWAATGNQSGTVTPGTTITGVTAGDVLHIYFCGQGPTAFGTVTDTAGAVTVGATTINITSPSSAMCEMAYTAPSTSSTHTIVVNVTTSCTLCNTFAVEWNGNPGTGAPLVSQNGAFNAGGVSVSVSGGTVSGTGTGVLETMYFAIAGTGVILPAGYSTSVATVVGTTIAAAAAGSGSFNPVWTTPGAGGNNGLGIFNALFQTGSGAVLAHPRLMIGVGQ